MDPRLPLLTMANLLYGYAYCDRAAGKEAHDKGLWSKYFTLKDRGYTYYGYTYYEWLYLLRLYLLLGILTAGSTDYAAILTMAILTMAILIVALLITSPGRAQERETALVTMAILYLLGG